MASLIERVPVRRGLSLADYEAVAEHAQAVRELKAAAEAVAPPLGGRTVWMMNSTSQGGGVAEMLPGEVSMLRQLGIDTQWLALSISEAGFFDVTKRVHNLIHGQREAPLTNEDRELYERISRHVATELRDVVRPNDIVIVHDPQPLAAGSFLAATVEAYFIWRCHIGLDVPSDAADAAWSFLQPYTNSYQQAIFSAQEYVPDFLSDRSTIIHPGVDPLAHKNRELALHKLVGILIDSGLTTTVTPPIAPRFKQRVLRLQPDGSQAEATRPGELNLLTGPVVTQVSRWDTLKGWLPLLEAFRRLKLKNDGDESLSARDRRRLELVHLVLAGPDPESIQDDPEGLRVFEALRAAYLELEENVQRAVIVLSLPMASRKENALIVNALQRASTIVVQNSLREAFGLTVAEAMLKRIPVLGSGRACGIRAQIRDGIDGRLIQDPENPDEIANLIAEMVIDEHSREAYGREARRRVFDEFLIFGQVSKWLDVLAALRKPGGRP